MSEFFWTRWRSDDPLQPQVWLSDEYNLYERRSVEHLTPEQQQERERTFLEQLCARACIGSAASAPARSSAPPRA
ncbi:hypothetical protein [Paenibacillus dendritiformis]|uniref:hypothetical protein n=1 Tax=Paenibacillus dendritiformis TaxID=130049 RepID=UPI001F54E746|nr:hypothetical protein [Paenibacillus dendritiformis]